MSKPVNLYLHPFEEAILFSTTDFQKFSTLDQKIAKFAPPLIQQQNATPLAPLSRCQQKAFDYSEKFIRKHTQTKGEFVAGLSSRRLYFLMKEKAKNGELGFSETTLRDARRKMGLEGKKPQIKTDVAVSSKQSVETYMAPPSPMSPLPPEYECLMDLDDIDDFIGFFS